MNSLLSYGSDDNSSTNSSDEKSTGWNEVPAGKTTKHAPPLQSDVNYEEVQMDLSEDSSDDQQQREQHHPHHHHHHHHEQQGSSSSTNIKKNDAHAHHHYKEKQQQQREKERPSSRGGSSSTGSSGGGKKESSSRKYREEDVEDYREESGRRKRSDRDKYHSRRDRKDRDRKRDRSETKRDRDRDGDRRRHRSRERSKTRSKERSSGSSSSRRSSPPPRRSSYDSKRSRSRSRSREERRDNGRKYSKRFEHHQRMSGIIGPGRTAQSDKTDSQKSTDEEKQHQQPQLQQQQPQLQQQQAGGMTNYISGGNNNRNDRFFVPGINGQYRDQIERRKAMWKNKPLFQPQQQQPQQQQLQQSTGFVGASSRTAPAGGDAQSRTTKVWEGTTFAQDTDGKVANKFKRLMGIKGATESKGPVSDVQKRQEEMFNSMEQQYEVARTATHTMRGVGLGFGSYQR